MEEIGILSAETVIGFSTSAISGDTLGIESSVKKFSKSTVSECDPDVYQYSK